MKKTVLLFICTFMCICAVSAFQGPDRITSIDDFEQANLVFSVDGDGIGVGYVEFFGSGGNISTNLTDAPSSQVPDAPVDNQVLDLTMTLPSNGFAGLVHNFTNAAADTWVTMDWSSYQGISLWIYGNNTGELLFLDVLDNRSVNSMVDNAQRWSVDIPDDFSGWRFFQFEWEDFTIKPVFPTAPNDGFGLTEVHGYAFGSFSASNIGTNTYYIDDVSVWGTRVRLPRLGFTSRNYEVIEGENAQIEVALDQASETPVMVNYRTAESVAVPERDFIPVDGTLSIPAGELTGTFSVPTIDNNKDEDDRSLMLVLYEINGAEYDIFRTARLTILDNDEAEPGLLEDFEDDGLFQTEGQVSVETKELPLEGGEAIPCQEANFENVLATSGSGRLIKSYAQAQDWTTSDGLSFWFYGTGSGEEIKVNILDNRSSNTATTPASDWELVWSDEFNTAAGTPPNPSNWTQEIGDGGLNGLRGWGNDELQFYTNDPTNASTDGAGNLKITVQEVNTATTDLICYYGPCEYTSARLITKNKLAFQYGRIETRILVPDGAEGLWPAFWSLGDDIDEVAWPQAGEIDIMEYVSRLPNEISGAIHGPGYAGGGSFDGRYIFGIPVYNNYHTFSIEWTPNNIIWYVDGIKFHEAVPADVAPNEWVFNKAFFLLLNMAVGGNFGGIVSESLTFPQEMLVDYVRVYQAAESAEHFETSFRDSKIGWQFINLPFDQFVRSNNQPDGAPNDGLGLNEIWGYSIILPNDFTANDEVLFDQIRLGTRDPESVCKIEDIPLMSNFALITLFLSILIIGTAILVKQGRLI